MDMPTVTASILVVDDTIENLRLLSGMLGAHGYEVRPVTRGEHAIRAAEHEPPDLVLLDVNMPEMSGYEVCARLKQSERLRDVPVIFLTALTDTADKVRAFESGGVDYVTKPFQIEEVLARVRVHLALRRARLDLAEGYARLKALERLRDELVHMVVHDMRSPLTVLLGHLDLLATDVAQLGEQAAQSLSAAIDGGHALNKMANDLLDVSRLEDGKMPLVRERSDLTAISESVCTRLRVLDGGRSIAVDAAGPVETVCDPGVIHRVIENLVNNAIKHTPRGGRISVRVGLAGNHATVAVEDQGPGVPAEARERIFEKFGTAGARKDGAYHSAGLGLAFCKLAVAAHGGSIGVTDGPVTGSVFWFELPA